MKAEKDMYLSTLRPYLSCLRKSELPLWPMYPSLLLILGFRRGRHHAERLAKFAFEVSWKSGKHRHQTC